MSPQLPYHKLTGQSLKRGKPSYGSKPNKETLHKLYVKESRSIREIALILGCTKDMIQRALKEYKIRARTNVARSRLERYPKNEIANGIRKKGIRGYAQELGVHENTLRHYLKVHMLGKQEMQGPTIRVA